MNRRRGVTLTEVLVAIFVTGLGLMALMTLFPLGAVNMALAVKDDRAAHASANGAAFLRTLWREGLDSGQPDPNITAALANGPVYLDPIGQLTYAVGGGQIPGTNPPILRISPTVISSLPQGAQLAAAMKFFSLQDDLVFNLDGVGLKRDILYTWAYMLRPPQPANPRVIDYSVVIYNRRSASVSGGGVANEIPMAATFNPGNNSITVAGQPPANKGNWVMDNGGNFYRISSVSPGLLKVDQPLKSSGGGVVVIMKNVIAVSDKSTLE